MKNDREHRFLAYCMKQGYISMDKVKKLLKLKEQGKSIVTLIAVELGWDKGKVIDEIRRSRHQEQTNDRENMPEQEQEEAHFEKRAIGKYLLVEKLGAGGMGAVYKAYHRELETYFAIKIILSDHLGPMGLERFKREAKISSQLRNPNIVRVYDVGVEGENHYIVMDYIKGKDLGEIVKEKSLLFRESLNIVLKIARALEYAHEMKVIHRDIKPANILVADNHDNTPYLMDFGLAVVVQDNTRLTRSGQLLGTPQYMSPEQAQGETHSIDGRSDIYSLGAVLYELLTGKPVVEAQNNANLIYKVIQEEPVLLSRHRANISKDVEAITMKCLEKDPDRRYQKVGDLAEDIDRYLRGEAVLARSPGPVSRLWRRLRRAWKSTLAITALILCVIGVWIYLRLTAPDEVEIMTAGLEKQARQLEMNGNLKGAGDLYLSILKLDKDHAPARECLGKVIEKMEMNVLGYENADNLKDAQRVYGEILLLDKGHKGAIEGMERIRKRIEGRWAEVKTEEDARKYDKALEHCKTLVNWDPRDERFVKHIVELTQKKDECREKARKFYERAMEIFWNTSLNEAEIERCKKLFESAIEADPSFADAYFQAGRASHRLFDKEKAILYYKKCLELDPGFSSARYYMFTLELPEISRAPGDIDKKLNDAWNYGSTQALLSKTNDPYFLLARVQFLFLKLWHLKRYLRGKSEYHNSYKDLYRECLEYCNKVINDHPTFSDAYFVRAQLYSYMLDINKGYHQILLVPDPEDIEQALKDCSRGLYLDPFRVEFYSLRGAIYRSIGAFDLAEKDYANALLIKHADKAGFYRYRAMCYLAMRNLKLALDDLNRTITLSTNGSSYLGEHVDSFLLRSLFKACMTGDKKGALEDLASYMSIKDPRSSPSSIDERKAYDPLMKTIISVFIDDETQKAESSCEDFLKLNGKFLMPMQLILKAVGGASPSDLIHEITLLYRNMPNMFCAAPNIKTNRKKLKALLSFSRNEVSIFPDELARSSRGMSIVLRMALDSLDKDPIKKEKMRKIDILFEKTYPPLTAEFLLYSYCHAIEQPTLQRLRTIKRLPSASLYYYRAIDYYLNGEYEKSAEDLEAALDLEPNYMEAHYGLSTVYSILSMKNTSYRSMALYHLGEAIACGWSHVYDYTLKDDDFKNLWSGEDLTGKIGSWERKREENQKRIDEVRSSVNELISAGKAVRAIRLLYTFEFSSQLKSMIDSTEKRVMDYFLKRLENEKVSDIDEDIEDIFGKKGKIKWEWAKRISKDE